MNESLLPLRETGFSTGLSWMEETSGIGIPLSTAWDTLVVAVKIPPTETLDG